MIPLLSFSMDQYPFKISGENSKNCRFYSNSKIQIKIVPFSLAHPVFTFPDLKYGCKAASRVKKNTTLRNTDHSGWRHGGWSQEMVQINSSFKSWLDRTIEARSRFLPSSSTRAIFRCCGIFILGWSFCFQLCRDIQKKSEPWLWLHQQLLLLAKIYFAD